MSKRRRPKKPATPMQIESAVRESYGHDRYMPTNSNRRLRCSSCHKTWKFSDKLNCAECPRCKKGRLT